jgi:hypothetical protein
MRRKDESQEAPERWFTRWLPVSPSVGGWFDPRCLDPCVREGARIRFGLVPSSQTSKGLARARF